MGDKARNEEAIKKRMRKEHTKIEMQQKNSEVDEDVVRIKLILMGPKGSGKTSWVKRLVDDKFSEAQPPTDGAYITSQGVAVDGKEYFFTIFDLSGEDFCKELSPMYLQHANVAIVFYDMMEENSFRKAKEWFETAENTGEKNLILSMVGTKADLTNSQEAAVSKEEVEGFFVGEKHRPESFLFHDISSKTGKNVQNVLLTITELLEEHGLGDSTNDAGQDSDDPYGFAMRATNNEKTPAEIRKEKLLKTLKGLWARSKTGMNRVRTKSSAALVVARAKLGGASVVAGRQGRVLGTNVQRMSRRVGQNSARFGATLGRKAVLMKQKIGQKRRGEAVSRTESGMEITYGELKG